MTLPPDPITALRAAGVPDSIIARAYGVTRQAIHARYGPRPDVPLMQAPPAPHAPPAGARGADLPRVMRAWRARRGLSQNAAAATLGVDVTTWSRWETGRSGCGLPGIVIRLLLLLDKP
jgi:hypothetical protein